MGFCRFSPFRVPGKDGLIVMNETVLFPTFVPGLPAWIFPRMVVSGSVLAIHCLVFVSAQHWQSLQHSEVNTRGPASIL